MIGSFRFGWKRVVAARGPNAPRCVSIASTRFVSKIIYYLLIYRPSLRRDVHVSTPLRQNPTLRANHQSLTTDDIMRMKKQHMAAARARVRAQSVSLSLPGAPQRDSSDAKPAREKAIRKIRVSPEIAAANQDVPPEELLATAVSSVSRLYDRRIRKKLNRGDIDEAIASVVALSAILSLVSHL